MNKSQILDTPFSESRLMLVPKQRRRLVFWIVGSLLGVILLFLGVWLGQEKGSDDRYRKLESFPINEFLESYETLLGGRFMMNATMDAELGTEDLRGKLVAFRDTQSKKVVAVLLSNEAIPNYALSKSQRYNLILEVERNGVLSGLKIEKE